MSENGEIQFPAPSPAVQLRTALTEYLKEHLPYQCATREGQIRSAWDTSGEITQPAGVYTSAIDRGGHNGLPGRVLVDVDLSATAWSHLNEDSTGMECDIIASCIQQILADFEPTLQGWIVRGIDSWEAGEITVQDAFRQCEIKTTIYLQNSNY